MKKILIITLLLLIGGCSAKKLGVDLIPAKDVIPDNLELKTTKDNIIKQEVINIGGTDVVVYDYVTEDVVEETVYVGDREDVYSNSLLVKDENGVKGVKVFSGSDKFYKDSKDWKHIKHRATTTKEAWDVQIDKISLWDKLFKPARAVVSTTTYSSIGDGFVDNGYGAVWDTVRTAASGGNSGNNPIQPGVRYKGASGGYKIYRGYNTYDTSAFPDDATISSSSINLRPNGAPSNGIQDAYDYFTVVQSDRPSVTAAPVNADYNNCGGGEALGVGNRRGIPTISGSVYENFAFDSDGFAMINLTGVSQFCILEGHDFEDQSVGSASDRINYIGFNAYAQPGQTTAPYLYVEYSVGGGKKRSPSPKQDIFWFN